MARRMEAAGDTPARWPRSSARASSIRHRRRLPPRSPATIRDRTAWPRPWPPASRPSSSTRTTSKRTTCSPLCIRRGRMARRPPPAGQTVAGARARAIEHLDAIQSTPLDGDQSQPADDARPPAIARRQGRHRRADSREGRAAGAVGRRAADAAVRSADVARPDRGSRRDAAGRGRRSTRAIGRRSGSSTNARTNGRRPPPPMPKRSSATTKPSRDVQIRYAAALINTDDGAGKARDRAGRSARRRTPNDTRVLYLLSTAERTDGDLTAAEATARRILAIDPTSVTGLRALVAVLFDRFDYKQVADVVAPLVKDPSRAKGREFEGAAVLVQLGIAQQQLGAVGRGDRRLRRGEDADAARSRDRRVSGAGPPHGAPLRSRRGAGARGARARSGSAAHGAPARAGAVEGRQGRRGQQAARRRRGEAAGQPRIRGRPRRSLRRSEAHRRCAARCSSRRERRSATIRR